jgi:hypothetical protein
MFENFSDEFVEFLDQQVQILAPQTYTNGFPDEMPVLCTVPGSLQPVRRTQQGIPAVQDGVQQSSPTHRLFIAWLEEAVTASGFRVDGVTYYPTRAPSNTGGQGHHLEIELSQTRPQGVA